MRALAAALAALAAHAAWVVAPFAEGQISALALGAASLILGLALAFGWARRSPWAVLGLAPTIWWLAAPATLTEQAGLAALVTLGAHLIASLAVLSAPASDALDAGDAPAEVWRALPEPGRAGAWPALAPWGALAAVSPLLAVALALTSQDHDGAARIAWAPEPERALAGLGALGVVGGLLLVGGAVSPRRPARLTTGGGLALALAVAALLALALGLT